MSAKSLAEERFWHEWQADPLAGAALQREFRFHAERKWRFDFALPAALLAIEIEGRGRHQTVVGTRNDCEKYNSATIIGWRILRFPATDHKLASEWVRDVKLALCCTGDT